MMGCMENKAILDRIHIVLVDTQDGANIGSVCRAMKTMGIHHLDLVSDREYDEDRVRTLALHAADLWEQSVRYPSLEEALKDSALTVAATRRRGKFRKLSAYSPEQLSDQISKLPKGRVSIVFGRESDGLRDDEVQLCSTVVTIPTSDDFPSLNLSQAVQIVTYTLFTHAQVYSTGMTAVTHERVATAAEACTADLDSIGYFKWDEERKWTLQFLKDTLEKAGLSEGELQRFEKLFSKTATIKKYRKDEEPELS